MTRDLHLNIGSYLVPLLVVGLVALRLVRNKPRKVKPNRLFMLPVLLTLAAAVPLSQTPSPLWMWIAADLVAAAAGVGVGYLSGRHREFTVDGETGEIMSRATPTGTIVFGALFAVRFGLKYAFPQLSGGGGYGPAGPLAHPAADAIGWTDAGLVFSTALLLSTAAATWWRTRHLVPTLRTSSSLAPDKKLPEA